MVFSRQTSLEAPMAKKKTAAVTLAMDYPRFTAQDIATEYTTVNAGTGRQVTRHTVTTIARTNGIGTVKSSRLRLFTEADKVRIMGLIVGARGNPNMGTENAPKPPPRKF
jgi:hypothetical protein